MQIFRTFLNVYKADEQMTDSSFFHSDIKANLSYTWLDKGTTHWAVIVYCFLKYADHPLKLVSE